MPLICSALGCAKEVQSVCAECGVPYCSRECQKAAWRDHKPICAILSAQKPDVKLGAKSPASKEYPRLNTEALLKEASRVITDHRIAHMVDLQKKQADDQEEQLFSAFVASNFSTQESINLRETMDRARKLLADGFTDVLSKRSDEGQEKLARATTMFLEARGQIIERVSPGGQEVVQNKQREELADVAYTVLLEQAKAEVAEGKGVVQNVQCSLDTVLSWLPSAQDPHTKGRTTRARLLAQRKNAELSSTYERIASRFQEEYDALDQRVGGRLASKLAGLFGTAALFTGSYLLARRTIDPDGASRDAMEAITLVNLDLVNADQALDRIGGLVNQSTAILADRVGNQLELEYMFQTIRTASDNASINQVAICRDFLKAFLSYANKTTDELAAIASGGTEAERISAFGTVKDLGDVTAPARRMMEELRTDLIKAETMLDMKALVARWESVKQVLTGVSGKALGEIDAMWRDKIAEEMAELAVMKDVMEKARASLEAAQESTAQNIDMSRAVRSTAPLTSWMSSMISNRLGWVAESAQVNAFLQLTLLPQFLQIESMFGAFLDDAVSQGIVPAFGSLLAHVGASFMLGETSAAMTFLLGGVTNQLWEEWEKFHYKNMEYHMSQAGIYSGVMERFHRALWFSVSGTRVGYRFWRLGVAANSMMTMVTGLATFFGYHFVQLVIATLERSVYIVAGSALVIITGLVYNYVCREQPLTIAEIVGPIISFATDDSPLSWRNKISFVALLAVWVSRDQMTYIMRTISRRVNASIPTWDDVRWANQEVNVTQLVNAKSNLSTVMSTFASENESATFLLNMSQIYAAGANITP